MLDREVMSELLSSIREGVGYNEVYPSGRELEEDFPQSLEKEPFTYSFNEEEEKDKEDEEGKEDEENDEGGEEDEGYHSKGVEVVGQVDRGARPFILPLIWKVNDFNPMMSNKVFNTLQDCYQIPENIPIHLPQKFEKCYSWRTVDVGMYNAMFIIGLRLPLTSLHH